MADKNKYADEIMSDEELDGVAGGIITAGCNDTISFCGSPGMTNDTVYSGNNMTNSLGSKTNYNPNKFNYQTSQISNGNSIIIINNGNSGSIR